MIIDCHFHVDETMLTLEKMIEEMDKNNVEKTALIPPFNETMFEKESTYQVNLHHLFRFLIMNFPKLGFKIYDGLVKDGYFKVNGSYKIFKEPNNDIVANAIKRYPDRFLGWAAVNPTVPESVEMLETYLNLPGFIGVKAHPFMHKYSIKELDSIGALCQNRDFPMIIHLSSELDSYKYLPDKYPNLKVIYAHAGLPFWKSLWQYVKGKPNVYVDTSSDYLTPTIVRNAVQSLGYRKVLYGCDGPYGMKKFNEYDYSDKSNWIKSLDIPQEHKDFILGKNFLDLIKSTVR